MWICLNAHCLVFDICFRNVFLEYKNINELSYGPCSPMFQCKIQIILLSAKVKVLTTLREGTDNCEFVCKTIVLKLLQYFEDKIWIVEKWTIWDRSHYNSCCKMIKDGKNQFPPFAQNIQVLLKSMRDFQLTPRLSRYRKLSHIDIIGSVFHGASNDSSLSSKFMQV